MKIDQTQRMGPPKRPRIFRVLLPDGPLHHRKCVDMTEHQVIQKFGRIPGRAVGLAEDPTEKIEFFPPGEP
jgi:hypothetical protein